MNNSNLFGLNARTLAEWLTDSEYPLCIDEKTEQLAKESNLLIVFGASDDLLEFRGAIHNEAGAYNGTTVFIDPDVPCAWRRNEISESYAYAASGRVDAISSDYWMDRADPPRMFKLTIEWLPKSVDASWLVTADVPFEPFKIMEDGEIYCVGAVIDLKAIASN